jgi:putative sigma-54 modulation protein
MQLELKGRNLEVSDSIRDYVERKFAKVGKLVNEQTVVEVELSVEKNPSIADSQVAEATIWMKGHVLRAREGTRDMKASIDELTEKVVRQIQHQRDRRISHRRDVDKRAAAQPE